MRLILISICFFKLLTSGEKKNTEKPHVENKFYNLLDNILSTYINKICLTQIIINITIIIIKIKLHAICSKKD